MSTDAEKRAVANYQKKVDHIMLRPSKEDGALIRSAAKDAGMSVQGFVIQTVKERIKRDLSRYKTE